MIRRLCGLCFILFMALAAAPASAAEVINSFVSDITLEKSGAMTVTETITVNAEGNRIRRGIFRDFPLTFVDEGGRRRTVDFDVVSVTRDGHDEPWKTESISGGIRIYAGSEDVMLLPGRHQYAFTYRTNRQIRYFDDHDELYWNVTGNGWIFPIMEATATVNLPDGVTAIDTNFFTGPLGATEQECARFKQRCPAGLFDDNAARCQRGPDDRRQVAEGRDRSAERLRSGTSGGSRTTAIISSALAV